MRKYFVGLAERYSEKLQTSDIVSIVGINGAILSIIIGLISAFLLNIDSKINAIETDALYEVNKINEIDFSPTWNRIAWPSSEFLKYWETDDRQLSIWLSGLFHAPEHLSMEWEHSPFRVYSEKCKINETEVKLFAMGALVLKRPFPSRLGLHKGRFVGLKTNPILSFEKIEDVIIWRNDAFDIVDGLVMAMKFRGKDTFLEGFNWGEGVNLRKDFSGNENENEEEVDDVTYVNIKRLPYEFCDIIEETFNIIKSLDYHLKRYKYTNNLKPSNALIIITYISFLIVFLFGVIFPLLFLLSNRFLILWLPATFYIYFLVLLTVKVSETIF